MKTEKEIYEQLKIIEWAVSQNQDDYNNHRISAETFKNNTIKYESIMFVLQWILGKNNL